MQPEVWLYYRGREDGETWATTHASYEDLAEWSDLPSFEYYMGAMPFPYDNEAAVASYERARSDAGEQGMVFNHQLYASGFLEAVYRIWHNEPAGR